jgi:hypothetical protein
MFNIFRFIGLSSRKSLLRVNIGAGNLHGSAIRSAKSGATIWKCRTFHV